LNEKDILEYLTLDRILVTKSVITKRMEIAALIDVVHDRDHWRVLEITDVNR
jgi:hypothetical protein